jgi:hypothetical protein
MDEKKKTEEEKEIDIDEEGFPWGDIVSCRKNKKSPETGETETDIRKWLVGKIKECPKCKKPLEELEVFYFKSPEETWSGLCGTAGWIVVCFDCKKQIDYFEEVIS